MLVSIVCERRTGGCPPPRTCTWWIASEASGSADPPRPARKTKSVSVAQTTADRSVSIGAPGVSLRPRYFWLAVCHSGKTGSPTSRMNSMPRAIRGQAVDLDAATDVVHQQHVLVLGRRGLEALVRDESPGWRDRRSRDEELVNDQPRDQVHDRRHFRRNQHQALGRPWDDQIRRTPGGGNVDGGRLSGGADAYAHQ